MEMARPSLIGQIRLLTHMCPDCHVLPGPILNGKPKEAENIAFIAISRCTEHAILATAKHAFSHQHHFIAEDPASVNPGPDAFREASKGLTINMFLRIRC
jgi:hypothetical protein